MQTKRTMTAQIGGINKLSRLIEEAKKQKDKDKELQK